MEEKKPTIQISKTGKVTVLNAQDIELLDGDGNPYPQEKPIFPLQLWQDGG